MVVAQLVETVDCESSNAKLKKASSLLWTMGCIVGDTESSIMSLRRRINTFWTRK